MPKHFMYQPATASGQDLSGRLELHWYRASNTVVLGATRWRGNPGQVATDVEFLPASPPQPAWEGPMIELPRSKINHLIKELRAARDQAYGRDE